MCPATTDQLGILGEPSGSFSASVFLTHKMKVNSEPCTCWDAESLNQDKGHCRKGTGCLPPIPTLLLHPNIRTHCVRPPEFSRRSSRSKEQGLRSKCTSKAGELGPQQGKASASIHPWRAGGPVPEDTPGSEHFQIHCFIWCCQKPGGWHEHPVPMWPVCLVTHVAMMPPSFPG